MRLYWLWACIYTSFNSCFKWFRFLNVFLFRYWLWLDAHSIGHLGLHATGQPPNKIVSVFSHLVRWYAQVFILPFWWACLFLQCSSIRSDIVHGVFVSPLGRLTYSFLFFTVSPPWQQLCTSIQNSIHVWSWVGTICIDTLLGDSPHVHHVVGEREWSHTHAPKVAAKDSIQTFLIYSVHIFIRACPVLLSLILWHFRFRALDGKLNRLSPINLDLPSTLSHRWAPVWWFAT